MRILVCGSRKYSDARHLFAVLDRLEAERGPIDTVIHGNAQGTDRLADTWARTKAPNVTGILGYQAEWKHDGKAAGPIRNQRMLDDGKPDLVVAFPGGKGTADMVARAERAGVEIVRITE